jgi:hypothetical protein
MSMMLTMRGQNLLVLGSIFSVTKKRAFHVEWLTSQDLPVQVCHTSSKHINNNNVMSCFREPTSDIVLIRSASSYKERSLQRFRKENDEAGTWSIPVAAGLGYPTTF